MAKSDKKADKKAAKSKPAKPAPSPAKAAPLAKAKMLKSNGKTPVKPIDSDSSDDDSEDEQPKKTVVSSSDSDSDDSPEEKKPAKAPASKKSKGKAESSNSSDSSASDESSSDEDVKMQDVQPTKAKKAANSTKGAKPAVSQPKAKLPTSSKEILANAKTLKANGKAPESSDESSDSSSEDEQPKKAASSSDSDGSSEEETPASVPARKAAKGKEESSGSSDSSSDESSSDEDENDAKVEDVQPAKGTKRKAEAEPAVPPKKVKLVNDDAAPGESAEETKSIFVGRLSWNVDNDWLAQEFAACGEVVSAHVQTDRATGKSRGFGYVHFATADAVEKALEMNGKEIDGRPVNIDKSTPPDKSAVRENRAKSFGDTQSPASNVLFVGNLSFGVNEDQLWELFGEHGDVKSVRVPTDRDSGRPKGFAYVEFSVLDAAKTAHEQLQGHEFDGRSLRLDFSQPRDNAGGGGGRGRGGFGDRGRGGFGDRGRGGFGDRGRGRGGFGGDRGRGGFGGDRGGRGRGRGGDRGGRGGGRGRGGPRTGAVAPFEGSKITFD